MHPARIAELLEPFLQEAENQRPTANGVAANDVLYQTISTYIDMLLRWNARINLTAIRDPEEIVTRHFGESLFAARLLFPPPSSVSPVPSVVNDLPRLADLGSGAGFPGIPIKLWAPRVTLTLIESNQKKVAFLREVVRALTLTNVNIFPGRAADLIAEDRIADWVESPKSKAARPTLGAYDVVTLRAVERFSNALPTAAGLVAPGGRLALLIGTSQLDVARATLPTFTWQKPLPIPLSNSRILLSGVK